MCALKYGIGIRVTLPPYQANCTVNVCSLAVTYSNGNNTVVMVMLARSGENCVTKCGCGWHACIRDVLARLGGWAI